MSEDYIINVIKFELATLLVNIVHTWLEKEQVYLIHTYPCRTSPNKVSQFS